jgi:hypothetical protein
VSSTDFKDGMTILVKGHVKIIDLETQEVILDKSNDINAENMSYSITQALAAETDSYGIMQGSIYSMHFGNGGTTIIAGEDRINYKQPRVSTLSSLYSDQYTKVVNKVLDSSVDSNYNSVKSVHIPGQTFSDIVITCTLGLSEPSGQANSDQATVAGISTSSASKDSFVFDELGLYDYSGKHLTHLIFHPIQKAANRILQIRYTIRYQLV